MNSDAAASTPESRTLPPPLGRAARAAINGFTVLVAAADRDPDPDPDDDDDDDDEDDDDDDNDVAKDVDKSALPLREDDDPASSC